MVDDTTESLVNDSAALFDDEEDECRVCRFPAEEGRPLFKPCKCSGSIGLIHQDCLQAWLEVQRGNGTCELCKTRFKFSPLYADEAPERLPPLHVLWGLGRRVIARCLPFVLRITFAASLWLFVAPLFTAYLYHGWMNRPFAFLERPTKDLITTDLVGGAVVAAYIIISFLSLMSFADFLRVEWQQRGLGPWAPRHPDAAEPQQHPVNDVDNGLWEHVQDEILTRQRRRKERNENGSPDSDDEDDDIAYDSLDDYHPEGSEQSPEDSLGRDFLLDLGDVHGNEHELDPLDPAFQGDGGHGRRIAANNINNHDNNNNNNNIRPQRNFDFDQEEPMDVDINIALDELLGVRGPLSPVLRNLVWLLSFNAVYIGFFCWAPRTVGMAVSSIFFNYTDVSKESVFNVTLSNNETINWTLSTVLREVHIESERQKSVFRVQDFATIALGYLACAGAAWFGRLLWILPQHIGFLPGRRTGLPDADEAAGEELNHVQNAQNLHINGHDVNGDDQPVVAFTMAIGVALDAMVAIVKVGVLLFLKMFLLPMLLGVCLDASTASLFHVTLQERIQYAGSDLFAFVLLHWVLGITFMLLVTVSVLQLREVAHPDLLSQVIRPQEPQPDLLGNLMHEGVGTHAKRMVVSLLIYAVLWAMHIYVPSRILGSDMFQAVLPSLKFKLCYIVTPRIQVPFELLFFHLCMLGLLERYKNGLGEMQHYWLKFLTRAMSIQESVLPLTVTGFDYIGSRNVFEDEHTLASFWVELAENRNEAENAIDKCLAEFNEGQLDVSYVPAFTKADGRKTLNDGAEFIRLPLLLPGKSMRSKSVLLPTKIGKYRLDRNHPSSSAREGMDSKVYAMHLWVERAGDAIPRPPEGWDDLGAEPPDVQGRWAHGNEKRSLIELGVACRKPFFTRKQNFVEKSLVTAKLCLLFVLSWIATTLLLCTIFVAPVAIGRLVYHVLRVPDTWIHDPAAFLVGFLLAFPLVVSAARAAVSGDRSLWERFARWGRKFRLPPVAKLRVLTLTVILWYFAAPIMLGASYDMLFLKSTDWYASKEPFIDAHSAVFGWATGTIILYVWSFLCVRGILTDRFRDLLLGRDVPENDMNPREEVGGWQGEHGRVAQFWDIMNAVVLNWDFSVVDRISLLDSVAIPVTMGACWTLFVPLGFTLGSIWAWPEMAPILRAVITRSLVALIAIAQAVLVWKDQLKTRFEEAHEAARDDLYLIGEVLQNYVE